MNLNSIWIWNGNIWIFVWILMIHYAIGEKLDDVWKYDHEDAI